MEKLLAVFCLLVSFNLPAQSIDELIGQGRAAMNEEDYEQANLIFRKALTTNKPIPSDFCYYFAETLYHIRQYQNSKSFIEKYFELSGATGEFYEETMALNKKVESELAAIESCSLCNDQGYTLIRCDNCLGEGEILRTCYYCKGKGKTLCNVCMGEGVVIKKNVFDVSEYRSCDKCDGSGVTPCPICQGEKNLSSTCRQCNGLGMKGSGELCDHPLPVE